VERVAEEGQRGGHVEDGHAESAGWGQNGSQPTGKSFGRYERYQNEASLLVIFYFHTTSYFLMGLLVVNSKIIVYRKRNSKY